MRADPPAVPIKTDPGPWWIRGEGTRADPTLRVSDVPREQLRAQRAETPKSMRESNRQSGQG